ncbi:MAG: ABC transporter permease [Micromonosporaceae bacterium]
MRNLSTLLTQTRYQLLSYVRTPRALLSGVLTPVVLMVLLAAISDHRQEPGYAGRLTAAMITLGLVTLGFTTLAGAVTASRDRGTLKRLAATPLPLWLYLAGQVAATVVVIVLQSAGLVALGVLVYDAELDTVRLAVAAGGILLGAVSISLCGLAVAQLIPRSDAAAPLLSAVMLPVTLISGIFFPVAALPDWIGWLGDALPLSHLGALLSAGFVDGSWAPGITWHPADFGWLAGWAVLGFGYTRWRFRSEPATPKRAKRRTPAEVV